MASSTSLPQSIEAIYQKLITSGSYNRALEDFKSLIDANSPLIVLKELTKQFTQINCSNKDICHFFPLLCSSNHEQIEVISMIVALIDHSLIESNSTIFPFIAKQLGKAINELFQSPLSSDDQEKAYKIIIQICLSSIYSPNRNFNGVGLLFLSEFIENCFLVKKLPNMKFIWKTVARLLDDKQFQFKLEALNCFISLIFATESTFQPFACDALFKILDYLTDPDWLIRKLALNVVYSLSFYCKSEIMPLKDNIIEFLNVLKYDKVKEIEEVCLQTLQIYQETTSEREKAKSKPKGVLNHLSNVKDNLKKKPKLTDEKGKRNRNSSQKNREDDKEGERYHSNSGSCTEKSNKMNGSQGGKPMKAVEKEKEAKSKPPVKEMLLDQDILKANTTQAPKRDSFFSNKLSAISKCSDEPLIHFSSRLKKNKKQLKSASLQSSIARTDNVNNNDSNRHHEFNDNTNTFSNESKIEAFLPSTNKTEPPSGNAVLSENAEKKIEELVAQIKAINEVCFDYIMTYS